MALVYSQYAVVACLALELLVSVPLGSYLMRTE